MIFPAREHATSQAMASPMIPSLGEKLELVALLGAYFGHGSKRNERELEREAHDTRSNTLSLALRAGLVSGMPYRGRVGASTQHSCCPKSNGQT